MRNDQASIINDNKAYVKAVLRGKIDPLKNIPIKKIMLKYMPYLEPLQAQGIKIYLKQRRYEELDAFMKEVKEAKKDNPLAQELLTKIC